MALLQRHMQDISTNSIYYVKKPWIFVWQETIFPLDVRARVCVRVRALAILDLDRHIQRNNQKARYMEKVMAPFINVSQQESPKSNLLMAGGGYNHIKTESE